MSNLDQSLTDEEFRQHFAPFGNILTFNIVRDKLSQQSKEFGFIKFETKEAADKAVRDMHESTLRDRRIRVEISRRGEPRRQTPGRYLGPRNPDERHRSAQKTQKTLLQ